MISLKANIGNNVVFARIFRSDKQQNIKVWLPEEGKREVNNKRKKNVFNFHNKQIKNLFHRRSARIKSFLCFIIFRFPFKSYIKPTQHEKHVFSVIRVN